MQKKRGKVNLFEEVRIGNFPNLAKEIDIEVQETQSPKQAVSYTHLTLPTIA